MIEGRYNIEYYSGSAARLYIGDVLVDEITSFSYQRQNGKRPLYGYDSQYFDAVSKGTIMINGSFTINFKEAGYLWLILDRYRQMIAGKRTIVAKEHESHVPKDILKRKEPWITNGRGKGEHVSAYSIERTFNGDAGIYDRQKAAQELTAMHLLQGYESRSRGIATPKGGTLGDAEGVFENFENEIWKKDLDELMSMARAADDERLNPFEMYIAFGDFSYGDYANHTMQRLVDVHITSTGKAVQVSGQPIQEQYSFFAKNLL